MLLTLFCVGRKGADVGLLTDGQNLAVHPRGRTLEVMLKGVPESVEPGESLRLGLDIRGTDGTPTSAMLGASVTGRSGVVAARSARASAAGSLL